MTEEMEMICFQLITAAGSAKSCYIEAVQKAKAGELEEARKLVQQGDRMMTEGHKPHTDLIQKEAAGEGVAMSLLLTHSEDQMMSCEVFKIMVEEIITLYERLSQLEKKA